MRPRPIVVTVTVVLLVLAAWLAWRPGPGPAPVSPPAATQTGEVLPSATQSTSATDPAAQTVTPAANAAVVASASATGSPAAARNAVAAASATPPAANSAAARDNALGEVGKVRRMIVDYHTLMGENPVGSNAEIMSALLGNNPHQATLGPPEGQALNDKGELVDSWGTPYFFHQLSGDHMEIHSAGPDRIMGTADDLVIQ